MSLPILHSIAGYATHRLSTKNSARTCWKECLLFIFIANLADLDFIPGFILGDPDIFHRGLSHSLFAAGLCAIIAGVITFTINRKYWFRIAVLSFFAYSTHIALDLMNGPRGIALFWPVSSVTVGLPFSILPSGGGFDTAQNVREFAAVFQEHSCLMRGFQETVLGAAVIGMIHVLRVNPLNKLQTCFRTRSMVYVSCGLIILVMIWSVYDANII